MNESYHANPHKIEILDKVFIRFLYLIIIFTMIIGYIIGMSDKLLVFWWSFGCALAALVGLLAIGRLVNDEKRRYLNKVLDWALVGTVSVFFIIFMVIKNLWGELFFTIFLFLLIFFSNLFVANWLSKRKKGGYTGIAMTVTSIILVTIFIFIMK